MALTVKLSQALPQFMSIHAYGHAPQKTDRDAMGEETPCALIEVV